MTLGKRLVILVAVLAFAITLAIVLGLRLSGQAAVFVFALTIGVVTGVVTGLVLVLLILRSYGLLHRPPGDHIPATIMLSPDQAELLAKLLARSQASPHAFTLRSGSGRRFTAVGGAEFPRPHDDNPHEP